MLDPLRRVLEYADLADAGNVARPSCWIRKLKLLWGVRVYSERAVGSPSLSLNLLRILLDLDDHELGRLQGGKAHDDVDGSSVDVVPRRGLFVALDEVRFPWATALEGALAEKIMHESTHVQADLRSKRLVIGLKDHRLGASLNGLLQEHRQAANIHAVPLCLFTACNVVRTPYGMVLPSIVPDLKSLAPSKQIG